MLTGGRRYKVHPAAARTNRLLVPFVQLGGRAFPVAGPTVWNSLPDSVISAPSRSTSRQRLKTVLFQVSFPGTSAGLMPTEARGNYLPEAPYLRETKTYLNCNSRMQCMGTSNMHYYQHNTATRFSSAVHFHNGPFLFFVADVMSNYLTTDGLKIFSLLTEAP